MFNVSHIRRFTGVIVMVVGMNLHASKQSFSYIASQTDAPPASCGTPGSK